MAMKIPEKSNKLAFNRREKYLLPTAPPINAPKLIKAFHFTLVHDVHMLE